MSIVRRQTGRENCNGYPLFFYYLFYLSFGMVATGAATEFEFEMSFFRIWILGSGER